MLEFTEHEKRALQIGKYVTTTGCTVRKAACIFNVSKSTVFRDLTHTLPKISSALAIDAAMVLKYNKSVRHIRGGKATQDLYRRLRGKGVDQ